MKKVLVIVLCIAMLFLFTGCRASFKDQMATKDIGDKLSETQPTPTDIDYSLERYNLIRRAYWVNGQREKADAVICPIQKPLGYVVLFLEGGPIIGRFVVDGKVSYLNSFLTPDSTSLEGSWIPDVDGSYGNNDDGIFFFTPDGNYIEWNGRYFYSDIPVEIQNPIVTYKEGT